MRSNGLVSICYLIMHVYHVHTAKSVSVLTDIGAEEMPVTIALSARKPERRMLMQESVVDMFLVGCYGVVCPRSVSDRRY